MRGKKILYVITKLELGGAQKQLLGLIRHLDRGHNTIFLFTAKEGLLYNEALSIDNLKVTKSRFLERPIHLLKDLLALYELYTFIKANNIDIIHTHSSKAGILGRLAARLAKVKTILHTVHGWSFNAYQPFFIRQVFILLERLTARFSAKLIVVSEHDRQKGLKNGIGNDQKYALIRYGINLDKFNINGGNNFKKELGIAQEALIIAMIACLKPQKSPLDFIRLAYSLRQNNPLVRFILIGDGLLRKKLKKEIARLKLKDCVFLLGWRNDIPQILSVVDIFVLTSLWEGLPISVLEAMAACRPVAATDTGGIREIIRDSQTGFLVQPKDVDMLSERIKVLLQDKNLRHRIGRNAREALGRNFCLEDMVRHTQNLYADLIVEKGGGYVN